MMTSYRSISNTYDAWSVAQMEAYIADLAVFGTNQVEFVAPDGNDDPHFQLTPLDMDVAMSGILDKVRSEPASRQTTFPLTESPAVWPQRECVVPTG